MADTMTKNIYLPSWDILYVGKYIITKEIDFEILTGLHHSSLPFPKYEKALHERQPACLPA
jgi:hypothetical protein